MILANALVRKTSTNYEDDIRAYRKTLLNSGKIGNIGVSTALVRVLADVDRLTDITQDNKNTIKLLFLAAGADLLAPEQVSDPVQ